MTNPKPLVVTANPNYIDNGSTHVHRVGDLIVGERFESVTVDVSITAENLPWFLNEVFPRLLPSDVKPEAVGELIAGVVEDADSGSLKTFVVTSDTVEVLVDGVKPTAKVWATVEAESEAMAIKAIMNLAEDLKEVAS